MKKLIIRRLLAYLLDYLIIAAYALFLFAITTILNLENFITGPIRGQLIGFISLTLPVFFYGFLMEKTKARATIGKRIMNIAVCSEPRSLRASILTRNILKLLPWEIAHTGVHWILFYSNSGTNPPNWVWIILIFPQIIMLAYLVSIITSQGKSSLYDHVSKTKITI